MMSIESHWLAFMAALNQGVPHVWGQEWHVSYKQEQNFSARLCALGLSALRTSNRKAAKHAELRRERPMSETALIQYAVRFQRMLEPQAETS